MQRDASGTRRGVLSTADTADATADVAARGKGGAYYENQKFYASEKGGTVRAGRELWGCMVGTLVIVGGVFLGGVIRYGIGLLLVRVLFGAAG